MAQQVKNLPAMQGTQETQVQTQGREDPLEKEMAIHSSILALKIPWTEEPGGLFIVHRVDFCFNYSVRRNKKLTLDSKS